MAGLAYKYITVESAGGDKQKVSLLDQNTMYAVGKAGEANPGTLAIGTSYNIPSTALFYASGGNIIRNVSGTGVGLSFGYKDETEVGVGNAGYYIGTTRVLAWNGQGGNFLVVMYREYQAASDKYKVASFYPPGGNILFYNGHASDGSALTFTDEQDGWSRSIKLNVLSNGGAQLRANNGTGPSSTWRVLQIGMGAASYYGPYTFTPGGEVDPANPYSEGGYSEPGGGDPGKQNFGDVSDIVNPDALPDETEVGAVGCGLITIFSPTQAQLTRLAEMLWNKTFYDFLVNQFNAIEDLFVSLGIVPFTVTKGSTVAISFMNFWEYIVPGGQIPTQVTLTKAANQWEEFNLGNVSLTGGDSSDGYASDSVLDYSPYSKLGIYLPFIGYQELDIDECRGKSINLKYRVDILSGACLALISINGRTLYQFTGNCMTQLPLTSSDYSQIVSTATNVAIAASSAGTAGALASAGDALTSSRVEAGQISPQMGEYQNAQHAAQVSNAENSLAGATANGLMGMKPNFKKTGAISGSTSIFGVMQPYLVLTTPRQSMPDGYNKVCGFPCNMGGTLSDFSGFTVVEDIRLNGLVATSPEVEEIYKLLKSGVII